MDGTDNAKNDGQEKKINEDFHRSESRNPVTKVGFCCYLAEG